MENNSSGITRAEKRVGEMNRLTQGYLEQSNRYLQQRSQPQSAPSRQPPQNMQPQSRPSAPSRQNYPQNVPNRNNAAQDRSAQNYATQQNFTPQNPAMNSQDQQRQNVPFRNNSTRNMQRVQQNQPQRPRFEAVGNSRQRPPQQFVPPPRPEPPKPPNREPNRLDSLLPIPINSDTAIIAALAAVLMKEKADAKLILALLYILF